MKIDAVNAAVPQAVCTVCACGYIHECTVTPIPYIVWVIIVCLYMYRDCLDDRSPSTIAFCVHFRRGSNASLTLDLGQVHPSAVTSTWASPPKERCQFISITCTSVCVCTSIYMYVDFIYTVLFGIGVIFDSMVLFCSACVSFSLVLIYCAYAFYFYIILISKEYHCVVGLYTHYSVVFAQ